MTAAPSLRADTLGRIIDGLCNAIAAHGVRGRLTAALLMLLWGRLRRTALRVRRLAERLAAGPLILRQRQATPRPARPPPPRLPRGHAWLVRIAPNLAVYGSQVQHALADPAMAELAAAPQMRRLLAPLCRMLGVAPPLRRPAIPPAEPPPQHRPPAPAAAVATAAAAAPLAMPARDAQPAPASHAA